MSGRAARTGLQEVSLLLNIYHGAGAAGVASVVLPLRSSTGMVSPSLMTHLLFWLSACAISTWIYCSPRLPISSSSCRIILSELRCASASVVIW